MTKDGIWKWLILSSAGLVLMYVGTSVHRDGPRTSTLVFEAGDATSIISDLNPEDVPHPSGSIENAEVAERISAKLRSIGVQVERQRALQCSDLAPGCTVIDNIIGTLPGSGKQRDTVLLLSHYDSVPGSPGAADDLAGVAVLIASAERLSQSESRHNDVVFLISDGEETGLRGAMAFVEKHELASKISLVINLEARGVAGPSTLFETGPGNLALIRAVSDRVSRPVGNSLTYEIYKRMPNDTDLSVFRESKLPALNFAFSRGASLYHSSRDSQERLSDNSVAHHGDNVHQLLDMLARQPVESFLSKNDATFVDIFGITMVTWPQSWNLPLTLLLSAVLLLALITCRPASGWAPALAFGVFLLSAILHAAMGWLLSFPLGIWPGVHPLDHPYPVPGNAALFGASILATLTLATVVRRRVPPKAFLFASWLIYALLGVLLAVVLPGASYIVIIPGALFAVSLAVEWCYRKGEFPVVSAWIGWFAASYIAVYLFNLFDAVAGFNIAHVKLLPFVFLAVVAVPLAVYAADGSARLKPSLGVMAAAISVATVIASQMPAYTADRPRSINVAYMKTLDSDRANVQRNVSNQLRVFSFGPPDRDFAARAGFPEHLQSFDRFGVSPAEGYLKPAPDEDLGVPILTVQSDRTMGGERVIKGTIRSGRSGFLMGLAFDDDVEVNRVTVEGSEIMHANLQRKIATFNGIGNLELDVEIAVAATPEVKLTLFELSPFPDSDEGRTIIELRPHNAASLHFGDHAEVQNRYTLKETDESQK